MIAVLFARNNSVYKAFPDCDVWDAERDALKWQGGYPVIAHPPCRAWGQLRHFSKPRAGEREMAIWAVEQVRRHGGILEHPAASQLWRENGLPLPGHKDKYGGFSIWIAQYWFGHRADKATLLYIVGIEPSELPCIPFRLGKPDMLVKNMGKAEREATPPQLAEWLIEAASRIEKKNNCPRESKREINFDFSTYDRNRIC